MLTFRTAIGFYRLHLLAYLCCSHGAVLPTPKKRPSSEDSAKKQLLNPEEYIESEPMDGFNIHENDILVPKKRLYPREVNSLRQWPSKRIPFEIDPRAGFMSNETDMLMLAFKEFADKSCVQFVPRQNERDYVFITTDPKRGCLSYIGWQGGKQEVFLLRPNCFYLKGTIIHELMHTIGFYHEHSRPDRDAHVQVMWENIRPDKMSNFQVEQAGNMLGAPYDYLSVMHYSALTFSKDSDSKQYTMVPRDSLFSADRLGQRRGFSPIDLQQLNSFYTCNKNRAFSGNLDDFRAPPIQFDPDDSQSQIAQFQMAVREPRNERPLVAWPQDESASQIQPENFQIGPNNELPINVDLGVIVPGVAVAAASSPSLKPVNSRPVSGMRTESLCSGTFYPNAILNFLGFFYLFKDGSYWKFSYTDGVFTREPNFPQAYSANFNADMPAQLDSVFSYLTYIYFVKGSTVWVAKSDAEIRGPVDLSQLFPGLPDTSWDNIFARGTAINFVLGSFSWVYDVKTDSLSGPLKDIQSALLTKGPVAELPDGQLIVFPHSNEPASPQADAYMLDRFTGKVISGYPRTVTEVFCRK
ncbi:putative Low choriolytic enzyme [Hypsibius exemplaris]|uniref:Metalloendopeptidase n=1 Tax=Hypsibius exemplaris TaxID=2072580 RepID=A0A1W0X2K0_HYPEX|nr:putative Low choriolytic enzyme [Hypsibius exemplaris]